MRELAYGMLLLAFAVGICFLAIYIVGAPWQRKGNCLCRSRERRIGESYREWVKDTSCMYHWQKSPYYKAKK